MELQIQGQSQPTQGEFRMVTEAESIRGDLGREENLMMKVLLSSDAFFLKNQCRLGTALSCLPGLPQGLVNSQWC